MSVTEQINMINQACEDLRKAYKTLADGAAPAMDGLDAGIGSLTQWKCQVISPFADAPAIMPVYTYWDSKPRWYHFFTIPIEEVPHPRAQEARDKAAELWGDVGDNDEIFKTHTDDIADTCIKVGEMVTSWLAIADKFATDVDSKIPSSAAGVPSSGGLDGWKSSSASSAYNSSVGVQNSAAKTTASIMSSLMMNCATFLSSMQGNLSSLASLTKQQNDFYADLLTFAIPDLKNKRAGFNFAMEIIDQGITIASGLKDEEYKTANILGTMLNDTIVAVLKLAELDRQLTAMGESEADDGWPKPYSMDLGLPTSGTPETTALRYNTQYFKDHYDFWNEVSENLAGHRSTSQNVPEVPMMYAQLPGFSANQSMQINALSKRLSSDAMGKGATATAELATKLQTTIKAYLDRESMNSSVIYQEFFGDE